MNKETNEKFAFKKIHLESLEESDKDQFIRDTYNYSQIQSDFFIK